MSFSPGQPPWTSCLEKVPPVLPQPPALRYKDLLYVSPFRLSPSRVGTETFLSTSMTPCVCPSCSRCSVNAYGWAEDWWLNGWISYYPVFPKSSPTTSFHQSQSLQWQLLFVTTYKWPTLLVQAWKMISWAVQMVVREHSGVRINVIQDGDHHLHLKKETCANQTLAILLATDLNHDLMPSHLMMGTESRPVSSPLPMLEMV